MQIISEIHLDSPTMKVKKLEWEEIEDWHNCSIYAGAKIIASKKHKKILRGRAHCGNCNNGALLFYDLCNNDADVIYDQIEKMLVE